MVGDRELQQDVLDELDFEPSLDAAHIGVTARDGVVTLSGHVANYAEKITAEQAARRVKGVRGIAEEIVVRLPSEKKRADDEIATRALNILNWDVAVPSDQVTIKVENGIVTLMGTVDWQYQKTQAETAVRRLTGVTGVVNQIALRTQVNATDVRDTIVKAFQRAAQLEAASIAVNVIGGKVTLTGRVHDWTERDTAERAAWSVPGVSEVHDQIEVRH